MRFNTVFVCVQTREYSRLVPYVRIQRHEPPQSTTSSSSASRRASGGTSHYLSASSRSHRRTSSTTRSPWRQWAPGKSCASKASELAHGSSSAHHIRSARDVQRRGGQGECGLRTADGASEEGGSECGLRVRTADCERGVRGRVRRNADCECGLRTANGVSEAEFAGMRIAGCGLRII